MTSKKQKHISYSSTSSTSEEEEAMQERSATSSTSEEEEAAPRNVPKHIWPPEENIVEEEQVAEIEEEEEEEEDGIAQLMQLQQPYQMKKREVEQKTPRKEKTDTHKSSSSARKQVESVEEEVPKKKKNNKKKQSVSEEEEEEMVVEKHKKRQGDGLKKVVQEEEDDDEEEEEEDLSGKKKQKRKSGSSKKTKKKKQVKICLPVEETVHCVGVVKLIVDNEETEQEFLIMSTHTNKIYCVTLDRISECMLSPFFEHNVTMAKDRSFDSNSVDGIDPEDDDDDDTVQIKYFTNHTIYRIISWKSPTPRVATPAQGGERLFRVVSNIIGHTFYFRSVNGVSAVEQYDDDEDEDNDAEFVNVERNLVGRIRFVDPTHEQWLKTYRRLFPTIKRKGKGYSKQGTDHQMYWENIDTKFDTRSTRLRKIFNTVHVDGGNDAYSSKCTMSLEQLNAALLQSNFLTPVAASLCKHMTSMTELHYLCKTLGIDNVTNCFRLGNKSEAEVEDLCVFVKTVEMIGQNAKRALDNEPIDSAPFNKYNEMWSNIGTHLQLIFTQVFVTKAGGEPSKGNLARTKYDLIRYIVMPRILDEFDHRARNQHLYNHATTHLITLDHVLAQYAELFNLPYTSGDVTTVQGDTLSKILSVINNCEAHSRGEVVDREKVPRDIKEDGKLIFGMNDVARLIDNLYLEINDETEPFQHRNTSFWWMIAAPHRPQYSVNLVPKKTPLFLILLDKPVMSNETALQKEFAKLHITTPRGNTNQRFNMIEAPLAKFLQSHPVDEGVEKLATTNFTVFLTTPLDVLKFQDMSLVARFLESDYYHTIVVLPEDNDYIRAMISRYLSLQNKVDMASFHSKRTVTCNKLKERFSGQATKSEQINYLLLPYANLWSSTDLLNTLRFIVQHRTHIKHVVFTGCIDMLPVSKGQPFVDMLRAADNQQVNTMVFNLARQVEPFNEIIEKHWEQSKWADCTVEKVEEFLPLFNRMTATVCASYRHICCVNNFTVLNYLLAGVLSRFAHPKIASYRATYGRIDTLTIHMNTRRATEYNSYKSMITKGIEKRMAALKVAIHFSGFTLGAVHTSQRTHVMEAVRLVHEKRENGNRHIYVMTMNELKSEASRHDLTTLFAMVDNLFIIDTPLLLDDDRKCKWTFNTVSTKNAIKQRFKDWTHYTTRYTSASYVYEYENEEANADDDASASELNKSNNTSMENEYIL